MYIILEMQTSNGATAVPPLITRDGWQAAESEFHRLCSIAAVSSVPIHTIVMLNEYGERLAAQYYEHEVS